jgi:FkbM family methyltransferase
MLINLELLYKKYNLDIKGVVHIGAHELEEKEVYDKLNIKNVIWFEANPNLVAKFLNTGNIIFCNALSDKDNELRDFIVTNNFQSSSLLELETHKTEHPHIHEIQRFKVITKKLDTIVKESNIAIENFNFMNIDIQGAELLALKGSEKSLKYIKYLYLEVNEKELYKGCALLSEIDIFLGERGFKRVEIDMTRHGWGDAFYIRE